MNEPKLRALSLGWGVQSFTLAAMSAMGELPKIDLAIHSDTTWERESTYNFAKKWTPWLEEHGIKIITVSNPTAARRIANPDDPQIFAPLYTQNEHGKKGQLIRTCTDRWKIQPLRARIREELKARGLPQSKDMVELWLGISTDEWTRARSSDIGYIKIRWPLLEKPIRMSRTDCIKKLLSLGIEPPDPSHCTICAYQSKEKWQAKKRENGHDWKEAVEVDEKIRNKRPGHVLFLHSSGKPLKEAVLIPEDQGYVQSDLMPGPGCDSAGICWD